MKKFLLLLVTLTLSIGSAMAQAPNWDEIAWLGDGATDGQNANKWKMSVPADLNFNVVNIQNPWGTVPGIYFGCPDADFTALVADGTNLTYDHQGAGVLLHLSNFSLKETEVKIMRNNDLRWTIYVYYADGAEGSADPVAVEGVALDKTTTSVYIGQTVKLTPIFTPANATNKNVTWSTSDATIATVEAGVVTGVQAGNATITVTTEDGEKTASCEVTVEEAPAFIETTWDNTDVSVAKGCPSYISMLWGGNKANMTDGVIDGSNCQLQVQPSQPVEWAVIDLGFNYDVTKLALTTTGDRKDKSFAFYVAPAQETEPAFADGNDALEGSWELAVAADEDYTNVNFSTKAYSVNLQKVRYVKYAAIERNHGDQYGTAICEIGVVGTTNDPVVFIPDHIALGALNPISAGASGTTTVTVYNKVGGALEVDPELLAVSSSNEAVATAALNGASVVVTGVKAGSATITVTYGELSASTDVTILAVMTAAPVPTHPADKVLSLYSDKYPKYDYNWYDWGGCVPTPTTIDGDNAFRAVNFKYLGSQFKAKTDVTGYKYFHVDIYPMVATTIGIIPITQNATVNEETGEVTINGNSPERGVTTRELVAGEWNSLDIPMADFIANGATHLDYLYQIKYNKAIRGADQWNCDGLFDVYFDNVYFWNGADVPEFNVVPMSFVQDETDKGKFVMNYTINHTNAADVESYHIWVVKATAPMDNMHRAAGEVVLGEVTHTDLNNLSGQVKIEGLDTNAANRIEVRAQANLNDGTAANATGWNEEMAEGATGHIFTIDPNSGAVTGIGSVGTDFVAPVYYTLQGVRVANPTAGLYIKVIGNKAVKVLVK